MKKFIISLLVFFTLVLSANAIPQKPKQLVNDYAQVLTENEVNALERKLVQFDSQTSTQIAIVTVKDLEGMAAIEMATRIMEQWGVGGKQDNGIVIVFKPKTANSNGQIAITTGYGVEHLVTDALAKQVVEYDFIPHFRNNDLYAGFDAGTDVLMSLSKGEFTGEQYLEGQQHGNSGRSYIFIIFVIIYILSRLGRSRRFGQMSSGGSSLPFWLLLGMTGGSSRGGGSFGDFSSGGGSFGGFGGGMGGGGGASGSW